MTADNHGTFGREVRSEFLLDPAIAYLNHGAFGGPPRVVIAEAERIRTAVERDPTAFMEHEFRPRLRETAGLLGDLIKGADRNIGLIENATVGVNAVLRGIDFGPDDEILITDQTYGAVRNAAYYVAERSGARIVTVEIPYPAETAEEIIAAFSARIGPRLRLAIIDHVTSPTALVLPIDALIRIVRERSDALVLVDGAHAPGMREIDVGAMGADWYTGNCHKWLFAAKGCAFIWASDAVRERTHPLVISHGYKQGFEAEFDWVGTRDAAPQFTLRTALQFRTRFGEEAIRRYNRELVLEGSALLARRWGTVCGGSPELTGSMRTVKLPDGFDADPSAVLALKNEVRDRFKVQVPIRPFNGQIWTRVSAQIYNELGDFERLADAIDTLRHQA